MRASWAVFAAVKAQEAIMLNMYVFWSECGNRSLLGAFLEASSGVLEALWAVWRPESASWTDRLTTRGPLGPSWEPVGVLLA
eukprot:8115142-Pyramimonas_sp.AAC.1